MLKETVFSGLIALGSVLAAGSQSTPGPPAELLATFIGNEAWSITDGKDVVLTDFPYESGYSGYMTWTESHIPQPPAGARATVLITHTHRDPFAAELLGRIPGRMTALVSPADARGAAAQAALAPEATLQITDLTVRPIQTPHANREHYSYVFEWHGVRFHLPGDTESPESLLEQRGLDVAFVTPWMLRAAERRQAKIDARHVILVHHEGDERVRPYQGSRVPRQGEVLRLTVRPSPRSDDSGAARDGHPATFRSRR